MADHSLPIQTPSAARPRSARATEFLLVALLIGVGIGAWSLWLRPALSVDATPLSTLPYQLEAWRGVPVELEDGVTEMLRADMNVMRAYKDPTGGLIWLYIGYYGTQRGGRPEHTPEVCYPSAGWEIRRAQELPIAHGLVADEFLVAHEHHEQLVHFWYRSSRRSGIHDALGAISDRILNRLLHGRADGALIRLSTPIDGDDIAAARARLREFAIALEQQLPAHWPREQNPVVDPGLQPEPT